MGLIFEVRLTHPQILILRHFQEWIDAGRPEKLSPFEAGYAHLVSTTKALQRERYLVHHEKPNKRILSVQESSALWDITEKGRAILKVIELEIKESSAATKLIRGAGKPKALQAGAGDK